MITLRNALAQRMHMRPPVGRAPTLALGAFCRKGHGEVAYVMENDLVKFSFVKDECSGFRLIAMQRKATGAAGTWVNAELDLWRLLMYDASKLKSNATFVLAPLASTMGPPAIEAGAEQSITLTWSNVSVGNIDSLNVVLTMNLAGDEDVLSCSIVVTWNGTPTRFAVDSICLLPLRVDPKQVGSDYAAIPFGCGIECANPITNLRFNMGGGRPNTVFGSGGRSTWTYPVGRGLTMSCHAYYEATGQLGAGEGWMVWNEQWDLQALMTCFQSDGSRMLFEQYAPMPNNLTVGNGGAALVLSWSCLRPFRSTKRDAYVDVAAFYLEQLDFIQPSWHVAKRNTRLDLSPIERLPFMFLDVQHGSYTGSTSYVDTAIATIRSRLGLTTANPAFGIFEQPHFNMTSPYEPEIGNMRATMQTLFSHNVFGGSWEPADGFEATQRSDFGHAPGVYDTHQQSGGNLRWWTSIDGPGVLRASRTAKIAGVTADNLMEMDAGTRFYRERTFAITAWNGTNTLTVTGNPSTSGFVGNLSVVVVPPSSSTRMGVATVSSLGASTVVTVGLFKDGQGATVTPDATYTAIVFTRGIEPVGFCPHAAIHASAYLSSYAQNGTKGRFETHRGCTDYFDTYDVGILSGPQEFRLGCYRQHGAWSQIDGGYVQHHDGVGSWYVRAFLDYMLALRQKTRDAQVAAVGFTASMQSCEDYSEATLGAFDFCWHKVGSGGLYRVTAGSDPAIHGYKAVPFFAAAHAGRGFFRALNNELNSGLVNPAAAAQIELQRAMGYFLAAEWVYGITLPTLALYADDATGPNDMFDDTHYVENGGVTPNRVRKERDLWSQMVFAEQTWLCAAGFRFGDYIGHAIVDLALTPSRNGYAGSAQDNGYSSYDVVYDHTAYPKVVHGLWRDAQGRTLVVMANWYEDDAGWYGTVPLAPLGLDAPDGVEVEVLDYAGNASTALAAFDPSSGRISVLNVTAYTVLFVRLTPNPLTVGGDAMPANVVQGVNSYVTQPFADEYMSSSTRGADSWPLLSSEAKASALITAWRQLERQAWVGSRSELQRVDEAVFSAAGSNYAVGDVLTLVGGTGTQGQVQVTAVDSFGSITDAELIATGEYGTLPATPNTPMSDSVAGFGAIVELTFTAQSTAWPRAGASNVDGQPFDSDEFPLPLMQAQVELAYELSQRAAVETQRDVDQNVSSVKAGSVGVTFFNPKLDQGRFPFVVQELIRPLLGGGPGSPHASAIGFGEEGGSDFSPERYGQEEGLP